MRGAFPSDVAREGHLVYHGSMAEPSRDADLEARVQALEARAQTEQAAKQPRGVSASVVTPRRERSGAQRGMRTALWALAFLAGAGLTFETVVHELQWHWGVGLLLAPVGGLVVLLLGKAATSF